MKKSYLVVIIILIIILICFFYFKKVEGIEIGWSFNNNTDYPGNEISRFTNTRFIDCKKKCIETKGCKGIITDYKGTGSGLCLLKSSLNVKNKIDTNNRYAHYRP